MARALGEKACGLWPPFRKILLDLFVSGGLCPIPQPETNDEINDPSFDPTAKVGFHISVLPAFHLGYPNINVESTRVRSMEM